MRAAAALGARGQADGRVRRSAAQLLAAWRACGAPAARGGPAAGTARAADFARAPHAPRALSGRGGAAAGGGGRGRGAADGSWTPTPGVRMKRSPFGAQRQQPMAALMFPQRGAGEAAAAPAGPIAPAAEAAEAAQTASGRRAAAPTAAAAAAAAGERGGQRQRGAAGPAPGRKEPECRLATLVRTVAEAERAVEYLTKKKLEKSVFAVDTETEGIDPTAQSPVGNGRVVCFSVYCGPTVDFTGIGETFDLSDVVAQVTPAAAQDAASSAQAAAAPEQASATQASGGREGLPHDAEGEAAARDTDGAAPGVTELGAAQHRAQEVLSKHAGVEGTSSRQKGALASKSKRLWVDTAGEEGEAVMQVFKAWLEDPKFKKVFHNWSFDSHMFANHGVIVKGFAGDTMHMGRLWDSSRSMAGGYKLSSLCHDLLGWGKTDMKLVFGKAKLKADGTPGKAVFLPSSLELQTGEDEQIFRRWVHYSTYDSLCTYHLYMKLRKELEDTEWNPDDVMSQTALPFTAGGKMWDPSARPTDPMAKLAARTRGGAMAKHRNLLHFYEKCWKPFGEILTDIERNGVFVNTGVHVCTCVCVCVCVCVCLRACVCARAFAYACSRHAALVQDGIAHS